MVAPPMDPLYEQRLRDEVIYLHSLWHQGPPRASSASASASASASTSTVRHHLQPSNPIQLKKVRKRRGKKSAKKPNDIISQPNSSATAEWPEWPCPAPPPPSTATGWPSFESKPDPKTISLSPEEELKLAAKRAHTQALKVVHEFFTSNNDDDSDAIDSSSDEDDELMEEDDGREEYGFFLKLFKEDAGLREFYENNYIKGEFNCLVCGAVGGKRMGKKFRGCLALVQHSISMGKMKKRRAHRIFGQAVCKVLGWDIDQLPTIVSLLSEKSSETQGNVNTDNKESSITVGNNVDSFEDIQGNVSSDNKETSLTIVNNVDSLEGNNGEAVDTGIAPHGDEEDTNSLACPHADKNLENLVAVHPHNAGELTSSSLVDSDADKNPEKLGVVHPNIVEKPVTEWTTSNSLVFHDADIDLENPGLLPTHNVEESATEGLASVTANENNAVGDETQVLQTDKAAAAQLNGLNEKNEFENSKLSVAITERERDFVNLPC